jgi:hypothetical protein
MINILYITVFSRIRFEDDTNLRFYHSAPAALGADCSLDYFFLSDRFCHERKSADDALLTYIYGKHYHLIVFAPHSSFQARDEIYKNCQHEAFIETSLVRVETLFFLKQMTKGKIVWRHEDTAFPYWQYVASAYSSVIDLYWVTDSDRLPLLDQIGASSKVFFSPAPVDTTRFFPREKNTFFYYSGIISGNAERTAYLRCLLEYFTSIDFKSFEINDKIVNPITHEEYAKNLGSSKCSVNFCFQGTDEPTFQQLKHRPLEILASSTLLLEQKNDLIERFFQDSKHFLSFSNPHELVARVHSLIENQSLIDQFAIRGLQESRRFSKEETWKSLLLRLGLAVKI